MSNPKPETLKNDYERDILRSIKALNRGKRKFKVEYESEFIPFVLERRYNPDFVITRKDGSKLYIESKGYLRRDDRSKLIAIRRQNPELDIRIIFQKNQLIKGTKSRYSDWADRHKYPYAIGTKVPKEWLDNVS